MRIVTRKEDEKNFCKLKITYLKTNLKYKQKVNQPLMSKGIEMIYLKMNKIRITASPPLKTK